MKIIALAVLLTVMQAGPPIPRKSANNPAQAPTHVKGESQAKTPSIPAPIKADGTEPTKSNSSKQHSEDTEHSISISKLPTVSVAAPKRDLADWAYWGFNFLLVVTSGFQVYLLFRTLGAVNRQAKETGRQVEVTVEQLRAMNEQITEMSEQTAVLNKSVEVAKESADAATAQIQMMKSKERARLDIKTSSIEVEGLNKTLWNMEAKLEFRNLGPSRAHITNSAGELIVTRKNAQKPLDEDEIVSSLNFPDSFIDPIPSIAEVTFYYFASLDETAPDMTAFATEFEESLLDVHLRGFVEYET